jgi:hypothetical protein
MKNNLAQKYGLNKQTFLAKKANPTAKVLVKKKKAKVIKKHAFQCGRKIKSDKI